MIKNFRYTLLLLLLSNGVAMAQSNELYSNTDPTAADVNICAPPTSGSPPAKPPALTPMVYSTDTSGTVNAQVDNLCLGSATAFYNVGAVAQSADAAAQANSAQLASAAANSPKGQLLATALGQTSVNQYQ